MANTTLCTMTLLCVLLAGAHAIPQRSGLPSLSRWLSANRHGNWCGAEHLESDEDLDEYLACTDGLDCACRAHQICQNTYGTVNCLCDNELVAALEEETDLLASRFRKLYSKSACYGPKYHTGYCRKCSHAYGKHACEKVKCAKCHIDIVWKGKEHVTSYSC